MFSIAGTSNNNSKVRKCACKTELDDVHGRRPKSTIGRKEMFYLTTHSTHFIYGLYGVRHMVKNHSYREREREMFYLTTHSTHFIYGYMASDIWLRTILIVRKETRCRHIGYSYRLTARVLLYAPSHRQDNTYHGLCYTSRGALAGTRNSSMGHSYRERGNALPPHGLLFPISSNGSSICIIPQTG